MHLTELKNMPVSDLVKLGEDQMGLENLARSRKQDIVLARQVSMYLAQKHTKMPANRIGKLVGGRDHSTVLHSCSQIEKRLQVDKGFIAELSTIENSFKLKS